MEENSCGLTVQDVAYLLQSKLAIITGGKTLEGYPVITFPDSGADLIGLSDEDFRKLMLYITSVPTMQDADRGFVLVVDRRNDKWSSVKAVLLKISGYFPALIQVVFVLRPSGLLQKAISGVSNKFFKEEFKFKVVVCTTVEELYSNIDVCQLTSEFGGTISYNHDEWIQQRTAVERFSSNTKVISVGLQEMIQLWQAGEMPNDVVSTGALIEDQSRDYRALKDDIMNAVRHGETLLSCIRRPSTEVASLDLCPDKLINVAAVERLLIQLDETEKNFDAFWQEQDKKLHQCLELRDFEQEFKEFQSSLSESLKTICDMPTSGDSLSQAEAALIDVENFRHDVEDELERAEKILVKGGKLIADGNYALDSIIPKCVELEKMVGEFKQQLHHRVDMLRKYCDLHEKIEKANSWCSQGIELLAVHQLEKCTSYDIAAKSLAEVELYLQDGSNSQIDNPEIYYSIFQDSINPETRALVQQVLKRIEDMKTVIEKRKSSLQKLAVKPTRPVQAVVPEPKVPSHVILRRRSPDRDRKLLRKGTRTMIEVCFEENEQAEDAFFLPIQNAGGGSQPSSQRNSCDLLQLKQGHIMTELIETEKAYVTELNSILTGYVEEIANSAMKDLIPPALIGQEDVLFGNMRDIYSFHSRIFLKDLENYSNIPYRVGQCFVERRDAFHKLYSHYCLNKPKSESLRLQCGDDNPFFKECQKNLGHKLPLGAYLLKPVQRITKYQLLLQDLLKHCEEGLSDLQVALDTMLSVLKYVNDSMHQIAITGFQGCLTDYGQLLQQSSFNIWVEKKKKERIRELRFKPHQRYIFFYEQLLLFTKKYGREESPSYAYKNALKMSQVGLTEKVHGTKPDSRKFELWLHGRSLVYILQAPSFDVKEKWVREIKKVLFQQFEHMKDENNRQYSDKILSLNGLLGPTPISPRARVVSSQSWDNSPAVTNNNVSENNTEKTRRATLPSEGNHKESLDNQDDGWTSDELSQTEDEDEDGDIFLNSLEAKGRYVVLGDYAAVDVSEASLHEGQIVEVEKIGCAGWWYVRSQDSQCHGWVPAAYLGPVNSSKRNSRSSPSVSSQDSGSGSLQHAVSKSSVASNMSCNSQEGTNL